MCAENLSVFVRVSYVYVRGEFKCVCASLISIYARRV